MPKVGSRHFSYTPSGRRQATRYAKRTDQKLVNTRTGSVKKPGQRKPRSR